MIHSTDFYPCACSVDFTVLGIGERSASQINTAIVCKEFMFRMTDIFQAVSFEMISNTGGIVWGRRSSWVENGCGVGMRTFAAQIAEEAAGLLTTIRNLRVRCAGHAVGGEASGALGKGGVV